MVVIENLFLIIVLITISVDLDAVIFNIAVLLFNIFTNKGIPIAACVPLLHKPLIEVNVNTKK